MRFDWRILVWLAGFIMSASAHAGERLTLANVSAPPPIVPDEPLTHEFSLERAARSLDTSALHWQKTRQCAACHTLPPYLMARPFLSEVSPEPPEVRRFFETIVEQHGEGEPSLPKDALAAVVIEVATALAFHDRSTTGKLHPRTRQELDHMWALQRPDGGWEWPFRDTPPLKSDENFGAALAALGTGVAPGNYSPTDAARKGLEGIRKFLKAHPVASLHQKAMVLWAGLHVEDLLASGEKEQTLLELEAAQRPDGGWSLASFVDNRHDPGRQTEDGRKARAEKGYGHEFLVYVGRDKVYKSSLASDGYATGLVIYVLRQAGVPTADARIRRGIAWLKDHQRESGRWFTPSQGWHTQHRIANAGTAFAVLALQACGEIPGPSQGTNIAASAKTKDDMPEALWAAVRNGDTKSIKALLDQGADVNAKNKIGVTALWIAAGKGKLDVIELLVGRGADVNARDGIWYQTPLSSGVGVGNAEVVKFLIRSGAKDIDEVVLIAAAGGKTAVVQALLDSGKVKQEVLSAALIAVPAGNKEVRAALEKAGAAALKPATKEEHAAWSPLAGAYENENGGKLTIELTDPGLVVRRFGYPHLLEPTGPETFMPVGIGAIYTFVRKGPQVDRVSVKYHTSELTYYRLETKPVASPVRPPREEQGPIAAPLNWPSFRGPDASGVADGQHPPLTWDVQKGINVRWKTPIPGLGHSCPVVWGDRVFVTTAVSGDSDPKVRVGNYGDVGSVNDTTQHRWQIFCLDRDSGKVLWSRTTFEGVPKIKRHLKGSQANCTPATDGQRVVACFGSEGLYCYDFAGKLLWQRDLGTLDSSFAIDIKYEWGFGSSPILHDGLVILQCDLGKDSFIAAYRLEDGARVWSTPRDEIPSWSTPTIWRNARRVELVTNAAQYARGYDPGTGEELWRLDKKSEVTIPTPIIGKGLVYLTSGNRPIQPIFAIRPGSAGDISLKPNEQHNDQIAWSRMRGGPYMTTPILYGDYLYTCGNGGMVSCYQADTGKEIYKERLGGESYTASPVAADQRLYFTSEQGQVRVVKAGPEFQLLAVNEIGDVCMATPAISCGMLFVRSQHFLFALGQKSSEK